MANTFLFSALYEPKLKDNRIGEGTISLAHSFAETFYQKELKKPFEINKADIPEEGNHIYHDLAGVLFFLMFAGVLVIFTVAIGKSAKSGCADNTCQRSTVSLFCMADREFNEIYSHFGSTKAPKIWPKSVQAECSENKFICFHC